MQFNVPQFTDVEDRVIGPLTVRQFLILLGAGGVTFLSYSLSKSIPVTVIVGIIVYIPALIFAFGQFNGRHLYRIIPVFFKFATVPKRYVFQKEAKFSGAASIFTKAVANKQLQATVVDTVFPEDKTDVHSRLKRIQYQLEQRKTREEELVSSQ